MLEMGSTPPMLPGEYQCELEQRDCRDALRFARDLWSRQFVLKHVAPALLTRSSAHATLHRGHVVVSVDGVPVTGLSMRRFTELWVPDASAAVSSSTRLVRMCDRRRAEIETTILKDLAPAPRANVTSSSSGSDSELARALAHRDIAEGVAQCQALMWSHRLQDAERALQSLLAIDRVVDPLLLVTRLELALIRVLLSNDANVVAHARAVAKHTLTWLQALSELPSLSLASTLAMRMALAETQLLAAALAFIANKTVQGVTEFRRCATAYADLQCQLTQPPGAFNAAARLPVAMRASLQARLRFGLGMLQLASATALQGPEWLSAIVSSVGCEPAQALDNLLAVSCGDDDASLRAAWASLVLFHSTSAVRLVQSDAGAKYMRQVALAQHQSLQRYPNSVLHLWAASVSASLCARVTPTCGGNAHALSPDARLARAVTLARDDECAHLLRFDAGSRRFVALDFDASTPLFMAICKCASAPNKLRGLCSVFLAATYVFLASGVPSGGGGSAGSVPTTTKSSSTFGSRVNSEQLFGSVRLLLRSALRFLDDVRSKDAEAACLAQRVRTLLDRADWALHLLPCEILYVYCANFASHASPPSPRNLSAPMAVARTDSDDSDDDDSAYRGWQQQHERALAYLDTFAVQGISVAAMGLLQSNGKVIKLNAHQPRGDFCSLEALAICEWSVLRASVLVHLGEFARAQQQLATLQALLPHVPASSFVPALAACYDVQIRLQQRLGAVAPVKDRDAMASAATADAVAVLQITAAQFEYSHIYVSRLKALLAVWAKTAATSA